MLWLAALLVCASCPHTSIQEAISAAPPGETIRVLSGVYKESVRVDRPLSLQGDGAILDGEFQREPVVIAADGVTFEGFEVRRSIRDLLRDTAALRVVKSRNCRLQNNRFVDNFFAIYLEEVTACTVRGNVLEGVPRGEGMSANGIHSWNSRQLRIEENRVEGHRDGIYLEFTSDSEISGNDASNNIRYGLHFMYSDNNRFAGNRFAQNGAGVAVMYSRQVVVSKNTFARHEGRASYGLLLKEISDSDIMQNRLLGNSVGMHFDNSLRNRVSGNVFRENGLAVSLWASAEGNQFVSNTFVHNIFDFHTNSTGAMTNVLRGNYYSSYLGYDLDRDGAGDLPHRPIAYSAVLIGRYPLAGLLAKSLFFELLDFSERLLPATAPMEFVDDHPALQPPVSEDG